MGQKQRSKLQMVKDLIREHPAFLERRIAGTAREIGKRQQAMGMVKEKPTSIRAITPEKTITATMVPRRAFGPGFTTVMETRKRKKRS